MVRINAFIIEGMLLRAPHLAKSILRPKGRICMHIHNLQLTPSFPHEGWAFFAKFHKRTEVRLPLGLRRWLFEPLTVIHRRAPRP